MLLADIAEKLNCILKGNGQINIESIAGIKEAREGELTFISSSKYFPYINMTKASAIIMPLDGPEISIPTLRTDNPYLTFAQAIELFYEPVKVPSGINPGSVIAKSAFIGKNPSIHACVVIGENVHIGDNVSIYPNVTIYDRVVIGNNVTIHSNAVIREYSEIGNNVILQNGVVIGGDGFSFTPLKDGSHYKIFPVGKVIIEDNVEIQTNTTVDRATSGNTIIKRGAKIDNLVQIAHGCSIGENTILCSQVGIAGSSTIGNNVILAGQVGIQDHVNVGDNVRVLAQAGVVGSIKKDKIYSGMPAIDANIWRKAIVCIPKLPELIKKLRKLEKSVDDILHGKS